VIPTGRKEGLGLNSAAEAGGCHVRRSHSDGFFLLSPLSLLLSSLFPQKIAVKIIVLACQELARPDLVTQPHSGPSCTFIIHCKVIDQTAPCSLGNLPSPWSYSFLCNHGCQYLPSQVCFPPHSRIGRRLTTRSRGWGWGGESHERKWSPWRGWWRLFERAGDGQYGHLAIQLTSNTCINRKLRL